jgi:hypothetical protein
MMRSWIPCKSPDLRSKPLYQEGAIDKLPSGRRLVEGLVAAFQPGAIFGGGGLKPGVERGGPSEMQHLFVGGGRCFWRLGEEWIGFRVWGEVSWIKRPVTMGNFTVLSLTTVFTLYSKVWVEMTFSKKSLVWRRGMAPLPAAKLRKLWFGSETWCHRYALLFFLRTDDKISTLLAFLLLIKLVLLLY